MDPIPHDLLGRYENVEGNSNKYWACNAEPDGRYKVTWGPRGTAERASSRQFLDATAALARIREKLRNGYEHTVSQDAAQVALERLALESLFNKASTTLKKRSRKASGAPVEAVAPSPEPEVLARPRRRL